MQASTPPPALPGSYLVLETTGSCNLACVHCDREQASKLAAEPVYGGPFLDLELASSLLADLGRSAARFDTLILFWLGDPLLHPHFDSLYPMLLRLNEQQGVFGKIEVHSNAVALSEALVDVALNQAGTPQVWHFTVDAARRATYRRIKGRDHLPAVQANIERFIARKGKLAATWPRLVLQFILCERNEKEAAAFQRRWRRSLGKAGLSVQVAAGQVPSGGGHEAAIFYRLLDCPTPQEQARQNAVFRRAVQAMGLDLPLEEGSAPVQLAAGNANPCSGFWKSPVIRWSGELTVCTRDSGASMSLGNLRDAPFSELWWGPRAEARRQAVARGDYSQLPLCDRCFIPRSANYTGITPLEIARHRHWAAGDHP